MILIISPKVVYATKRLEQEAKKLSIDLEVKDVKELAEKNFEIDIKKYHILYIRQAYPYFKQIINLAKRFAKAGKRVIDPQTMRGDIGLGKMESYKKLKDANLPIPRTEWLDKILNLKSAILNRPFVAKWNYGFGGRGLFFVNNPEELKSILKKYKKEELLWQEFIPAEYEYKIITVGFKSLPVVLRFKIEDLGFKMDFKNHQIIKVSSIPEVVELADKAAKILGRELAKVDILEAKDKLSILEVNRWPGLKSFEQLTKFNVAKEFIKYLT